MYWSQIQFYDKWNVWSLEEEISTVISYEMEEVRNCSTSAIRHPHNPGRVMGNCSEQIIQIPPLKVSLYFLLSHNSY